MLRSPGLPRPRRNPNPGRHPRNRLPRNRRHESGCRKARRGETGCQETRSHETACRETGCREARSAKGPSETGRPAEAEGRDGQAGSLAEAKALGWHAVTIETKSRCGEAGCREARRAKGCSQTGRPAEAEGRSTESGHPAEAEGRCHARNGRPEGSRQTGSSEANSAHWAALVRVRATSVGRVPARPRGPAAVAVLLVLLYHAGVPGFRRLRRRRRLLRPVGVPDHRPAGPRARATGRIASPAFYARRARRLLPAAARADRRDASSSRSSCCRRCACPEVAADGGRGRRSTCSNMRFAVAGDRLPASRARAVAAPALLVARRRGAVLPVLAGAAAPRRARSAARSVRRVGLVVAVGAVVVVSPGALACDLTTATHRGRSSRCRRGPGSWASAALPGRRGDRARRVCRGRRRPWLVGLASCSIVLVAASSSTRDAVPRHRRAAADVGAAS